MAFSTDSDLISLVPDILELGITSFSGEHTKAQSDIVRELRINCLTQAEKKPVHSGRLSR